MKKLIVLVIFTCLSLTVLAQADEREEPIDIIITLDKSLSMVEEIEAVKEYLNSYIIDQLLIPGDFFLVVAFYGETEIPVSLTIEGEEDKRQARDLISDLLADGRFTDIGNALDRLGKEVDRLSDPERKKYLLLITDGIQEAPPESKYYSSDGSFNHEFLNNTKIIQKKGWKIHVLGIGTYQAAQELAQELSGKYTEISEEPTSREFEEKTKDFLSTIEITDTIVMSGINQSGKARLSFNLESKGYTEEKLIEISAIELSIPGTGREIENILPENYFLTIPPEGSAATHIPVRLSSKLERGDYSGEVQFFFAGEDQFIPVVMEIDFHVKSFLGNYWGWILAFLILLILLIVAAILLISRIAGGSKVRFRLIVEGQILKREEEQFCLREGKFLFLTETNDMIRILKVRNPHCLAKLSVFRNTLRMALLKDNRFPKLRELPKDALDFSFRVRTESGKDINVRFGSMTKNG